MPRFDDATIEKLFGAEDAENEDVERFKEYFVSNRAFENLQSDLPIRVVVGHKGVGKSALLKRAFLSDGDTDQLAVWIQPNDIAGLGGSKEIEFNQRIENWKNGILKIIAEKATNKFIDKNSEKYFDNIDLARNPIRAITGILKRIKSEELQITNEIVLDNFFEEQVISVYIDDVDRGWSASYTDIQNISALLNAIRDLAGQDKRLMFRVGLRSDVYFLVRTSDESTDKIERQIIWVEWTNNEILRLIAKRIETFFDPDADTQHIETMSQKAISSEILSKIMTPKFEGLGHWSDRYIHHVLLSLCRKRPRDLVKLLHAAARNAFKEDQVTISSNNFEKAFEPYSHERMQDVINEFKSELPSIKSLLLSMRPTKKGRKTAESFLFSNDSMVIKIKEIISHNNLFFKNGSAATPKSIIHFLYKIDFITARRDIKGEADALGPRTGRIDRKYFDQSRFLANESVEFGYGWEIHPAYRWALQPQDVHQVLDSLGV
ncbi:P-loop ATPase, Sll1717 family [Maricaulis sp.]|uniref:P-loop ATPase, Sll1717 family n=1 Tax=Maricaulis sp. TaxID=1486257 RepID=UPI002B27025A|nr:hypothetical protein [Maricaulis sp.]